MRYDALTFCTKVPVTIVLAVPENMQELEYGLQGHGSLGINEGMLFLSTKYPKSEQIPMWMASVRFSLAMLWVDKNSKIVRIEEYVQPGDKRTYSEKGIASIEVHPDLPRKIGLRLGSRVVFGKQC